MDGHSTDGTRDILKRYEDQVQWTSKPDKGQSDALNKGLAVSKGEIIGWLNSDDLYLPGALQKVGDYFDANKDKKWAYGFCRIIDENDNEIRRGVTLYKKLIGRKFRYNWLLVENYISQPAVFIRKEVLEEIGHTNRDLHFAMDYELWLRIGALYPAGVIPGYLACFRRHRRSKSERDYLRHFSEEYQVARRFHKGRFLLFLHRLNVYKIIFSYRLFRLFGI
jgi:glycosyltransferase involved in cell wall biosynthesis